MKPERWKQVDELLDAALECPVPERPAFLDQACAGDEELRREVESLLVSDARAEAFIESPPARVAADLFTDIPPKPAKGALIEHYEVICQIGAGGMGEVYLVRDTNLGRKVALKLLPPSLNADPQLRARFFREAQLASALDHPNICTIHEVGQSSGFLFIAMQYIEGTNLKQLINSRPLKLNALLSIGLQAADALAAAHGLGIIHRDIKSTNIIITPRGQVKVLDFGLAKLMDRSALENGATESQFTSQLTRAGALMGTPSYMSPEQARGERVDHRSDIFSLGVVLYEMASGRMPFKGKSQAETMNAVINEPHAAVAEINEEISAELSVVIDRALSKAPAERYQSMGEMLRDLRQVGRGVGLLGSSDSEGEVIPYVPAPAVSHSRMFLRLWPIVLVGLLLLSVLFVALNVGGLRERLLGRGNPVRIQSLAVLPLENLSGDAAQDYFADGITDALIGELAKIGALRVISRTSAMHYRGTTKSLPQIAKELNVDGVVEGTVQRSSDRVRIRVQLIYAASDQHIWAETYERDLGDVLGLQGEVAQTIARQIQIKITPDEQARLTKTVTVSRKALDYYLQGRYLLGRRGELDKAIDYFQSALTEDPSYAPAYAGLAACYNSLGSVVVGELSPTDARLRAEESALKALQFDNTLAEAHAALGHTYNYTWNWAAAERELKRAIELNPNSAEAHSIYSHHLSAMGRADEAIAEANRAQELDPLALFISTQRGYILTNARRYDEAIDQLTRVTALDPNDYRAHWFLAIAYANDKRFAEAIATSEKGVVLSSRNPSALGAMGMCYGLAGRKAEANKVLDELLELNRRRYVTPAALAQVYIGLGDKDRAFAWLEKAYQERSYLMAFLKVVPLADPLRSDPRFDDLVRRIGLSQ